MTHKYTVQTVRQVNDILLLTLAPKHGRSVMEFEAGQYATISLTTGGRPTPMRCFSIVSRPGSGVLQFGMRVLGNFTQAAARLQPGEIVRVQGPFGQFTIDSDYDSQVVMLAAGIGITPFISMLRDFATRPLQIPVTLLYANRSAASIPFYDELQAIAATNPNLRIQYFCSDAAVKPRTHPTVLAGSITAAYLEPFITAQPSDTTYFVCGPEAFSKSMRSILTRNYVDASRILDESFSQSALPQVGSRFGIRTMTYGLSAVALIALTGFIMALDLSRTVPRLASAQVPATSQVQSSSETDDDAPATPATSRPSTTSYQQPTYRQTYQSPRSSVS